MSPRPRARRRFRRLTIRVAVEYESARGKQTAMATTLGAGGMFIATEDALATREKLMVSFTLPGRQRDYTIPARVVWSNRPEGDHRGALGMGIAFEDQTACVSLAIDLESGAPSPG